MTGVIIKEVGAEKMWGMEVVQRLTGKELETAKAFIERDENDE